MKQLIFTLFLKYGKEKEKKLTNSLIFTLEVFIFGSIGFHGKNIPTDGVVFITLFKQL